MRCRTRGTGGFPHRSSYPSENSPSPQPWRVTALVASSDFETATDPRPVLHSRCQVCASNRIGRALSLEALLREEVRTTVHF
jgi:hypothetical protein